MSKQRNPLIKRIPRELAGDWRKYLTVALFLILTIGFVSGMSVANSSMITSAAESKNTYHAEYGHFELEEEASPELIGAIKTGQKADIKQYYLNEARKELNDELSNLVGVVPDQMYRTAWNEAWAEITDEIDEEYEKAQEKYDLDNPDFSPVATTVYENFFKEAEEDMDQNGSTDGTIRVYSKTDYINQASVLEGHLPETSSEIAIDRMHAKNINASVGDEITVGDQTFTVVGLIAYVNYSSLFENTTDTMFDALKFNVGMVTEEGFSRINESTHYSYAWIYNNTPADEVAEKQLADNFMRSLLTQTVVHDNELEDFVARYANPAINFATDDMGSDMAMIDKLLDILIVIIAFVFAITISSTITREASTIGTLLASGYTRKELLVHYLATPVIVTFIAAIVGNILGYAVLKDVVAGMYYNSYSLPAYYTIWNSEAFLKTTVIPVVLMFMVNLLVITTKLRHTPLEFLRNDLKRSGKSYAPKLPEWGFLHRFRIRIIMQNAGNYAVLCAGIFFVSIILAMAIGMPSTLNHYRENVSELMITNYQYVLTDYEDEDGNLITTSNEDAEKFNLHALNLNTEEFSEEISIYGVENNSSYIQINDIETLADNEMYISLGVAKKYGYSTGDTIELDEKYENTKHSFVIKGIYEDNKNMTAFIPLDSFANTFDLREGEFTGFLSSTEITDLDEDQIAAVITEEDITKMSDQLQHSMGAYMEYLRVLCVLLAAVLIYLLTKVIIEKNETSISMIKILGYSNKEINSLYLMATSIVVVIAAIICVFLGAYAMNSVWEGMMARFSGWFEFYSDFYDKAQMLVFILIAYVIVLLLDMRRINKVDLSQALKNTE